MTAPVPALVPFPAELRPLSGPGFALTTDARVTGPADAVADLIDAVSLRTGIRLGTSQSPDRGEHLVRVLAPTRPADGPPDGVSPPMSERGGSPESYRLVSDDAGVQIEGADAVGLAHGISTLAQLLTPDGDGWAVPALEISDAPRFTHRGLSLDVARHFFPVAVVCRVIDHMASLKLNALHLHLSDDQGWRIAIPPRPGLTERGSAGAIGDDPGGFYSVEDYRRILAHAARRHVAVIPEIDGPGHTHAVGLAYPDLVEPPTITDEVRAVAEEFGGGLPETGVPYGGLAVGFSSLRIGAPAVSELLEDVFGALAGETPGPYLHVGGDEALGTEPTAYAAYLAEVTGLVSRLGKTPIAWHEAAAAEGLAPGTVLQYWGLLDGGDDEGTADRLRAHVARGGRLILSPADRVYLDMKPDADAPLGLTWANGPTSLARAYDWEPSTVLPGVADDAILGVEAALWTETLRTQADLESMLFPRLAAAAEVAWSPRAGPERSAASFRSRVERLAATWTAAGIAVGIPFAQAVPFTAAAPSAPAAP